MSVNEDFELDTATGALVSTGEDLDKAAKPVATATKVARTVILRK
jgi:hypothetical protein